VTESASGIGHSPPLVEVRGLRKSFGSLCAADDISLSVHAGEVLGVAGENGAGKSTLVRMLAGFVKPDAGDIFVEGKSVSLRSSAESLAAGIALVHQHFALIPSMTVEENLLLGRPDLRKGIVHFKKLRPLFESIADELGAGLSFSQRVSDLSIGGRQKVELIKALSSNPRLLILDEPTAVLPPNERDSLLEIVLRLKRRGTATMLISHKLDDHYKCCDRAIILRHGRLVGETNLAPEERPAFVRMIVGDELPVPRREPIAQGRPLVSVKNLTISRPDHTLAVRNVSFDLHAKEIVGLCGVEGNGQTELVEALAGMLSAKKGEIVYRLETLKSRRPTTADLRRAGLAHIPEDRLRHGIVSSLPLVQNWLFRKLFDRTYARHGIIRWNDVSRVVAGVIRNVDIRGAKPATRIGTLSGGNQQKFVLAREIDAETSVILAAHPTRGLDMRAVANVRELLQTQRLRGAAILFQSSDLGELWENSDRIMVMAGGELRGPFSISEVNIAQIGDWMTGR
jgi:general nucleoside transport system ATP-binding protein